MEEDPKILEHAAIAGPKQSQTTKTLEDGSRVVHLGKKFNDVKIPPTMSGVQFVCSGWMDCGTSEVGAFAVMKVIDDPEFLRSAVLDPVPHEDGQTKDILESRDKNRRRFCVDIQQNPECPPALIAAMAEALGFSEERDIASDALGLYFGADPLASTAEMRVELVCNARTPDETLRMMAREKRCDLLVMFIADLHLFLDRNHQVRPEFFRYVFEEAEHRGPESKLTLCCALLSCKATPPDITTAALTYICAEGTLSIFTTRGDAAGIENNLIKLTQKEYLEDSVIEELLRQIRRIRKLKP